MRVRTVGWPRVLALGALWALVYNLVWGVAWRLFMRGAWLAATAAAGRPFPWTPSFWVVLVLLTVPFGVALVAYIVSAAPSRPAPGTALAASLALWIPVTIGMAVWCRSESLPMRVAAVDSAVNLVAVATASLAAEWIRRFVPAGRRRPPQILASREDSRE